MHPWCRHCGASLAPAHQGPCPSCGGSGKDASVDIDFASSSQLTGSWERTREFLRFHWVWAIILSVIVLGSPFIGLLIAGPWGILIGFLLSVLSVPVGIFAVTKVHEILRGRF